MSYKSLELKSYVEFYAKVFFVSILTSRRYSDILNERYANTLKRRRANATKYLMKTRVDRINGN